jgi:3-methyladenine DNA glycosylase AlkD
MPTVNETLSKIKAHAHPENLEGMARFGIQGTGRLGLSVPEMRQIAKELGRDHDLALALWKTGIPDAMIIASMVDEPKLLTESQMDEWVNDFIAWDVCDQVCGNLFDKSPLAWRKAKQWANREEEFVKRAAFALIASLAWHDKSAPDEKFIALLPAVKAGATDERNFVRKAVNWALRQIGKRNLVLNAIAIETAREIGRLDTKSARWVAADALRELTSDSVQDRLQRARPRRGEQQPA